MSEQENVQNTGSNQQTITTDDLIFAIGDKEALLIQKNKYIQHLENQIKKISLQNYQYKENSQAQSELDRLKTEVQRIREELENKMAENDRLNEENKKLKEQSKKYYDLQNDNERLSRLLKEKDKKIKEFKESEHAIDGQFFENKD